MGGIGRWWPWEGESDEWESRGVGRVVLRDGGTTARDQALLASVAGIMVAVFFVVM